MEWSALYGHDRQPSWDDIDKFINNSLWQDINSFLQNCYGVKPVIAYSKCPAQRGWNVKYQKGGKALCTLYPMPGYFIALVAIGKKELPEADLILPSFSDYTQGLYNRTPFSVGAKWLMIHVTDKCILNDVFELIKIRKAIR